MGFIDNLKRMVTNVLYMDEWFDNARRERLMRNANQRDYYLGAHEQQLATKRNQPDDNLTLNFAGLIVDRGITLLLGQGIEFDLPGDAEDYENPETGEVETVDPDNQRYIDAVWRVNKKDILLQKTAQFGGINGTGYLKIIPEYYPDEEYTSLPRLVALDPLYMTVDTQADDIDVVLSYTNRYNVTTGAGEEARKEVTLRDRVSVDKDGNPTIDALEIYGFMDVWKVQQWRNAADTGGKWAMIDEQLWEYEFPPIIHWQNLPLAGSVYGKSDISEDVLAVQDRINFIASNISKIIRYHSHPKTWGSGFSALGPGAKWGADDMIMVPSESGKIANLEMASDLASSLNYLYFLQRSMFDLSRTTDLASVQDKLGALTNFGLRVLFFDSLAKLESKRELYGEALCELNRRLLVLWAAEGIDTDGGAVVWPEVLPVSESEQTAALQSDMNNGLLSKETAAGIRGYDWQKEQERIAAENEANDSAGARLLAAFERGQ